MPFPVRLLDHVVPANTPLNTRIQASQVNQLLDLDADQIRHLWDPWTCPIEILPYLAWSLSVDLWDDKWPEPKKRAVVAASFKNHRLKGTLAGYEAYLGIVDCRVVDYIAPPGGFILGPVATDEDRAAWLRGLPELRLYTGNETLAHDDVAFFFDLNYPDLNSFTVDRGAEMAARKARIYDPATGLETQIGPVDFDRISSGTTTVEYEQIIIPLPYDPGAFYFDAGYFDVRSLIPPDPTVAPVFTWRTNTVGAQGPFNILDALPAGLSPIDAQPTRVPLRTESGEGFYFDISSLDLTCVDADTAALGFYDSYKLARVGEKFGTPIAEASSYFDLDYVAWPDHTLHLLVDASATHDGSALYYDLGYFDRNSLPPDDTSRFNDAVRATYFASGPSSDLVTISTETTRNLTLSDGIPLDGSFYFGKRVARMRT
jgi:hypothetical protein